MKKVLVVVTIAVIIALFAAYKCSRSRGEDVEVSPETSQTAPVETSPETSQTEQNEEPSEEVKEEPAATPAKEPKKEGRKAKPAVEKPAAEKPAPTAAPAEKKPVAREEKAVLDRPMPEVKRAPNEANIDSAGVTKVINVSRAAIKRCYDKALISNPQLKGKMSIKIVINKEGRVDRTEIVDDSLHDAEVAKCVKGVIGRLRFPKPADGTATVTFPFAFDPKNH